MNIRISYSHTVGIWMLRGVVERVCLPAESTVTHDFADQRGDSKVAGSLECTNDGLRQRGICSLTTGGVSIITILDGNKSLCRLACRGRPSYVKRRVRRHWPISGLSGKKPTGLPVRCLSRGQHGKPAFDRKP